MPVKHPIFARLYTRVSKTMERSGMAEYRRTLLAGLSGTVVEVGAGNGLNFAHYPDTVDRVVAVEPEPYLRQIASANAKQAPVAVDVVDGIADRLPLADGTAHGAVVSLVLCSVPDQAVALREIHRVLTPGGKLHFLEHVQAESRRMQRLQRVLDSTIRPYLTGGCHAGRDTASMIERSGFTIDQLESFDFPDPRSLSARHILGTATRTDPGQS
ncbi:class I SAM-dependent methyltransferase [Saccharomonospora sp. NPDC046836]|uniref:class I SAM-dependent methyltransferase n=1 Tax=Saccharomonospora sp. NPDC046836 TaxID=3156921 RepID=UPI0033DFF04F